MVIHILTTISNNGHPFVILFQIKKLPPNNRRHWHCSLRLTFHSVLIYDQEPRYRGALRPVIWVYRFCRRNFYLRTSAKKNWRYKRYSVYPQFPETFGSPTSVFESRYFGSIFAECRFVSIFFFSYFAKKYVFIVGVEPVNFMFQKNYSRIFLIYIVYRIYYLNFPITVHSLGKVFREFRVEWTG